MKISVLGEEAQEALGRCLAAVMRPPLVIWLEGELGSGKTTLTRGVLRGLGHDGPVRSPTYTLLEPYDLGPWRVFHLDLYRLGSPEELEYLGLRDLLDEDSILMVEWPQKGRGAVPVADVEIHLSYLDEGRSIEFIARNDVGSEMVHGLLLSVPELNGVKILTL